MLLQRNREGSKIRFLHFPLTLFAFKENPACWGRPPSSRPQRKRTFPDLQNKALQTRRNKKPNTDFRLNSLCPKLIHQCSAHYSFMGSVWWKFFIFRLVLFWRVDFWCLHTWTFYNLASVSFHGSDAVARKQQIHFSHWLWQSAIYSSGALHWRYQSEPKCIFPPFSSGYSVFHVLIFHNNFFFNNKERKWDSSKLGSAIIHRKFNKIDFRKGERLKIYLYLMKNVWESRTYIVQSLVT